MGALCKICNKSNDLRAGVCFDCASTAEHRAATRNVLQHLRKSIDHFKIKQFTDARICFMWALERATNSGDYKKGGYFDKEYPGWRK